MTDTQIQDIYARLDSLTVEVNSLKTQIGVVGTTQYAVVQILNRLERVEDTQARHSIQLDNLQVNVDEILRILRDRNGGTGL
jgi:archaellum component FlaC